MNKKGYLMDGQASQIIRANRDDVFKFISNYENIPKWSKMFKNVKVVSKKGNVVTARVESRILGIKFKATITGVIKPYEVSEEVVIDDGMITKDQVKCSEVPEGTRLDWTGQVVKFGKWTKIFGPLMKFTFVKSVEKDFKILAEFIESGKYKEAEQSS